MLEKNPKKRITAEKLLNHKWFESVSESSPITKDSQIIKNIFDKMLNNHLKPRKFRSEVLKLLVNEFSF